MAEPVRLVAEAVRDGFLKIGFKQGDQWMKNANNDGEAVVVLQYPRQGEMMRFPLDPTETEKKEMALNSYLKYPNELLKAWCS